MPFTALLQQQQQQSLVLSTGYVPATLLVLNSSYTWHKDWAMDPLATVQ
jgi:hypothetical protein